MDIKGTIKKQLEQSTRSTIDDSTVNEEIRKRIFDAVRNRIEATQGASVVDPADVELEVDKLIAGIKGDKVEEYVEKVYDVASLSNESLISLNDEIGFFDVETPDPKSKPINKLEKKEESEGLEPNAQEEEPKKETRLDKVKKWLSEKSLSLKEIPKAIAMGDDGWEVNFAVNVNKLDFLEENNDVRKMMKGVLMEKMKERKSKIEKLFEDLGQKGKGVEFMAELYTEDIMGKLSEEMKYYKAFYEQDKEKNVLVDCNMKIVDAKPPFQIEFTFEPEEVAQRYEEYRQAEIKKDGTPEVSDEDLQNAENCLGGIIIKAIYGEEKLKEAVSGKSFFLMFALFLTGWQGPELMKDRYDTFKKKLPFGMDKVVNDLEKQLKDSDIAEKAKDGITAYTELFDITKGEADKVKEGKGITLKKFMKYIGMGRAGDALERDVSLESAYKIGEKRKLKVIIPKGGQMILSSASNLRDKDGDVKIETGKAKILKAAEGPITRTFEGELDIGTFFSKGTKFILEGEAPKKS